MSFRRSLILLKSFGQHRRKFCASSGRVGGEPNQNKFERVVLTLAFYGGIAGGVVGGFDANNKCSRNLNYIECIANTTIGTCLGITMGLFSGLLSPIIVPVAIVVGIRKYIFPPGEPVRRRFLDLDDDDDH